VFACTFVYIFKQFHCSQAYTRIYMVQNHCFRSILISTMYLHVHVLKYNELVMWCTIYHSITCISIWDLVRTKMSQLFILLFVQKWNYYSTVRGNTSNINMFKISDSSQNDINKQLEIICIAMIFSCI
jgi:hypothetical protein